MMFLAALTPYNNCNLASRHKKASFMELVLKKRQWRRIRLRNVEHFSLKAFTRKRVKKKKRILLAGRDGVGGLCECVLQLQYVSSFPSVYGAFKSPQIFGGLWSLSPSPNLLGELPSQGLQ